MLRLCFALFFTLWSVAPAFGRQGQASCGTYPEKWKEERHLHRQSRRARSGYQVRSAAPAAAPRPASRDVGGIVVLEDSDGVVARRNEFNLDRRTVTFQPLASDASRYRFETTGQSYDELAASSGVPVAGLTDDDSRLIALPFAFRFFGRTYEQVYLNSDGNLTFEASDNASADRSVGRMVAGPPRISGLFSDLDPSKSPDGVRVASGADRVTITWLQVPEYQDFGTGRRQTFQIRLHADGRIELAWAGIDSTGAVIGIAPGGLKGSSAIVSFATEASGEYSAMVAERFGGSLEIDVTTAAQKFYEDHEDAYDYLIFFNNQGIAPGGTAVAWEATVRNHRTGYGDPLIDVGQEYGSPGRLQAVINMGPLDQYPTDPYGIVRDRSQAGDTPLTVLAHETGHLFLAFASIRDPNDPEARPMLGFQLAHWNFAFNSDASLLEGNRIEDRGPGVSPRFRTVATVQGYSALDQYLMGFRPPWEVPPTFLVTNAGAGFARRIPQAGVEFDGVRREVTVGEIIQAEGRRTPDHTVSQRRFRFAFVLIVREGEEPGPEELAQVERYRNEFEVFFAKASGGRAAADTSLRKSLALSVFPAAGVVMGRPSQATLTLQRPTTANLPIALTSRNGSVSVPGSVTIPAGQTSASFTVTPIRAEVDEIQAEPLDRSYDSASGRVQVTEPSKIRVVTISGDRQTASPGRPLNDPVVIRVTDGNNLPYPGLQLLVSASVGSTVLPASPVTDAQGEARLRWTPGSGSTSELYVTLSGVADSPNLLVTAARLGAVTATAVVNAASFTNALAPGAIGTVYGVNLSTGGSAAAPYPWPESLGGVRVTLNGRAAPLLFVGDRQINFLVPADVPEGTAELMVTTPVASTAPVGVPIQPVAPGIFFDTASGYGAVLNAGTVLTTLVQPARRGGVIEVYCTGLGPVQSGSSGLRYALFEPQVFVGGVASRVLFSGLAPGYVGLYQINVEVPDSLGAGEQSLSVELNGSRSNSVRIGVQ